MVTARWRSVSADEYATWGDAWRAWKAGETGNVSPFHTEHLKSQEWRLTDQGAIARKELESDSDNVLDFVLKRGPYGPGYYVRKYIQEPAFVQEHKELLERYTVAGFDWKVLPRLPLCGYGRVVEIRRIENPTGSQPVNLTNWAEGGDALAAAFGRMLGPMFEAMSKNQQANTSPSAVNDNAGAETPASKTEQGEGNGGADSTPGQPATDPNANRKEVLAGLQPADRKAYLAYQYAETMAEKLLKAHEAHKFLKEHGIDPDKDDTGELTDYEPRSLETWSRQVRKARHALGEQRYTRRGGRATGRSIVSGREIEYRGPKSQ